MYASRVFSSRLIVSFLVVAALAAAAPRVEAQGPTTQGQPATAIAAQEQHQHQPPAQPTTDHAQHEPDAMAMFPSREASGTAWLPNESPMYAIHRQRGVWELMAHGTGFTQFLYDSGDRGDQQFGSINWVMGMAQRPVPVASRPPRHVQPRAVDDSRVRLSRSLATGERCDGQPIHDRQHQHDLFMEVAADYDRPSLAPCAGRCTAGRRRAGARARRVSASHFGHAEPAGADCASLARRDAHHVWCRHRGVYGRRGRPKPRRSTAGSPTTSAPASTWRRSTQCRAACGSCRQEPGVAAVGGPAHRSRACRRRWNTNRCDPDHGVSHVSSCNARR